MHRPISIKQFLLVVLALFLLFGGASFSIRLAGGLAVADTPHMVAGILETPTPFQPQAATQTPFRPVGPTATSTPTPLPTPTPFPSTYVRFGIDFNDTNRTIKTELIPASDSFNGGRPVRINFRPGWPCEWINHRGCTSLHYQGQVVLATIHSGVGGDGQHLRHSLEGTWLNSAALSIHQIQANLALLWNSSAIIVQGETTAEGLRVKAAVRVPASLVGEYFALPVDDALNLAAQSSPELADALTSTSPLLVIETCGWRLASEGYPPGTSDTSASVYLIAIGE